MTETFLRTTSLVFGPFFLPVFVFFACDPRVFGMTAALSLTWPRPLPRLWSPCTLKNCFTFITLLNQRDLLHSSPASARTHTHTHRVSVEGSSRTQTKVPPLPSQCCKTLVVYIGDLTEMILNLLKLKVYCASPNKSKPTRCFPQEWWKTSYPDACWCGLSPHVINLSGRTCRRHTLTWNTAALTRMKAQHSGAAPRRAARWGRT